MKITKKQLIMMLLVAIISFARAHEDDEDDLLGELMFDLMVGGAIEICASFYTCSMILSILTVSIISFMLISLCITGCRDCRCPTERQVNRGFRHGAGIYAGRRVVRGFM